LKRQPLISHDMKMDRLDPKALAIAVGAAWGSAMLLAGWAAGRKKG